MNNENISISSRLYDYDVFFVDNTLSVLESFQDECVYVIDNNVFTLYKDYFSKIPSGRIFLVDAVEEKKNMETSMEIISFFSSLKMKKNWKVICFGGGITQDLTTVSSNLFLRNVDWYFFPTTLLSMCDSCIGGKCGINFNGVKNQLGVFYPPKRIYIDLSFLNTLTNDDYLNGWGELLKFSLTSDPLFYDELKKEKKYIPCENIKKYIKWGLEVKKAIIEEDEFESDLRRVLNYGHTFGHALESYTKNAIPHGKGVIWGIDVANYIAMKEGLIDEDYYLEIKSLIKNSFLKEVIMVDEPDALFEIIKRDKKVKNNVLYFALLRDKSKLCVYPINIDEKLEQCFEDYLSDTYEYYNN